MQPLQAAHFNTLTALNIKQVPAHLQTLHLHPALVAEAAGPGSMAQGWVRDMALVPKPKPPVVEAPVVVEQPPPEPPKPAEPVKGCACSEEAKGEVNGVDYVLCPMCNTWYHATKDCCGLDPITATSPQLEAFEK